MSWVQTWEGVIVLLLTLLLHNGHGGFDVTYLESVIEKLTPRRQIVAKYDIHLGYMP